MGFGLKPQCKRREGKDVGQDVIPERKKKRVSSIGLANQETFFSSVDTTPKSFTSAWTSSACPSRMSTKATLMKLGEWALISVFRLRHKCLSCQQERRTCWLVVHCECANLYQASTVGVVTDVTTQTAAPIFQIKACNRTGQYMRCWAVTIETVFVSLPMYRVGHPDN